ncbi:MAG: MFS transporter [Pseudomonadota bacterium]
MTDGQSKLTLPRVLAFAGVGVPLAAVGLPMAVFVAPMYSDNLGLGTTLVGVIFMLLRFWDLASDVIMGWLVDTRPTKRGRVKHWLLAGVPVLGLGAWLVFAPQGESVGTVYLALSLAILWAGFTLIMTPHQSWVPLITTNYDERSRMFMWREVINTATLLSLLVLPFVLQQRFGFDLRQQVAAMGVVVLIALPITIGLAVRFVPDAPPDPSDPPARFNWTEVWAALRDPVIARLLLLEIFVGFAIAATGSTFLFAARDGFGLGAEAPIVLLIYFVVGFASMPLWIAYSKRSEKHLVMRFVCLWSALTFPLYFILASIGGGLTLIICAAVLTGVGYGTPFILARSMMADIIERAQVQSGTVRPGLYYSLMSASYKTGASLAIGIPYIILGALIGFDASGDNPPDVVTGLMLVFVGVPMVCYLIAAALTTGYSLTRQVQQENAAALDANKLGGTFD